MKRFEKTVNKLYKAFSEGKLNAYDRGACAIGNICDNDNGWAGYSALNFDPDNRNSPNFDQYPMDQDYSPEELKEIEFRFLREFYKNGYNKDNGTGKRLQFNGLMSVIDYLAELDGIEVPNPTKEMFKKELV